MTAAQLQALVSKLQLENAALAQAVTKATPKMSIKIGAKGGVSVYGLGRFPVTLYKEQWVKLFGHSEQIQAFLTANDGQLKNKGE